MRIFGKRRQLGEVDLERPWEAEYRDECTVEDIFYCFRLLLGRLPGKEEWKGHSALTGGRLQDVVPLYLTCAEFKNRKLGSLEENTTVVDLNTHRMYLPLNDPLVGQGIFRTGNYEPSVTNVIRKNLRVGDLFVDVGANIGYFTLLAASVVGSQGQVLAFEPFSTNVKFLYLSKCLNDFDQITIYPFALADRENLCFYGNVGSNGQISAASHDPRRVFESTLVYSVRLDSLLEEILRLDMIKVDVEGAENLVLSGAQRTLARYCPIIISEFAPPSLQAVSGVSPSQYLNGLMLNDGYNLYVLGEKDLIPCGKDCDKVMNIFADSGVDHIDIMAAGDGRNIVF
jgi:FkbM family methyltransferase